MSNLCPTIAGLAALVLVGCTASAVDRDGGGRPAADAGGAKTVDAGDERPDGGHGSVDGGQSADAGAMEPPFPGRCVMYADGAAYVQECISDADCAFRNHGPLVHRCALVEGYGFQTCVLDGCATDGDCLASEICVDIVVGRFCSPLCDTPGELCGPAGYGGAVTCQQHGNDWACVPTGCVDDADCAAAPGARCRSDDDADGLSVCIVDCPVGS